MQKESTPGVLAGKLSKFIGRVLIDKAANALAGELYIVTGCSYNELALVRLFRNDEISTGLLNVCYKLTRPLSFIAPPCPLYADITRLISKDVTRLKPLLEYKSELLAGRIPKTDMKRIIALVYAIKTISDEIKFRYLNQE